MIYAFLDLWGFSFYHRIVAVRKRTRVKVPQKKKKLAKGKKIPWVVLFWLIFAIVLLGLYLFNREAINNSIMLFQQAIGSRSVPRAPIPVSPVEPGDVIQIPPPVSAAQPGTPTTAVSPPPVEPPPSEAASSQGVEAVQGTQAAGSAQSTAELRDRALYFIRIDGDGSVFRVRVDRGLPVSDSPLRDAIQALIAGPNAEEGQRGLVSLIPQGTRLLSVTIRGDTAYINFNEDFQYNTYGTEGYIGQLRQVVFTATEFANVRDVQILIEGSRVDYLGANIWIGSPLGRETF